MIENYLNSSNFLIKNSIRARDLTYFTGISNKSPSAHIFVLRADPGATFAHCDLNTFHKFKVCDVFSNLPVVNF